MITAFAFIYAILIVITVGIACLTGHYEPLIGTSCAALVTGLVLYFTEMRDE